MDCWFSLLSQVSWMNYYFWMKEILTSPANKETRSEVRREKTKRSFASLQTRNSGERQTDIAAMTAPNTLKITLSIAVRSIALRRNHTNNKDILLNRCKQFHGLFDPISSPKSTPTFHSPLACTGKCQRVLLREGNLEVEPSVQMTQPSVRSSWMTLKNARVLDMQDSKMIRITNIQTTYAVQAEAERSSGFCLLIDL